MDTITVYPKVDNKEGDRFLPEPDRILIEDAPRKKKNYFPPEIRIPFLLTFCVITLAIFTLLELAAASSNIHARSNVVQRRQLPSSSSGSVPTESPSTAPNPDSYTNFDPTPTPGAPARHSFTGFEGWGPQDYFLGSYLPTLIAVMYGVVWKCVFARIKEMEPFFQLHKPHGATAKNSLLLSYPDDNSVKVLLSSLRNGHTMVFTAAINMGLVTICTALAPEVLYTATTGNCGPLTQQTGEGEKCIPSLETRKILAWILGGIVFVVFALVVYLMVALRQKQSGIFAESNSIAGLAALLTSADIQWRNIDSSGAQERFCIGYQDHRDGTRSYGLISDAVPSHPEQLSSTHHNVTSKPRKKPLAIRSAVLSLFWVVLVGVLVLILYYRYVSKPSPDNTFETFMDSETFGVRFLFTCIGLGIRFYWTSIERYDRAMEPYRALSRPNGATATQSILLSTRAHPVTALFSDRTIRDPMGAIVSFMAVLAEVLIISLGSVPFSKATAYTAFDVSVLLSTVIIGLMLLVVPMVMVRYWRSGGKVVEAPKCIADVLEMLNNDEIIRRFSVLALRNRTERDQIIQSWEGRYYLRRRGNRDGDLGWDVVMAGKNS